MITAEGEVGSGDIAARARGSEAAEVAASSPALRIRHIVILGCILFLTSNVLFCQALRPVPALFVLAGCALTLWVVARETRGEAALAAPVDIRLLLSCIACAAVVFLLAGQGHIFYAADDWIMRDAVLADLVSGPMPIVYAYGGESWLLRAPLGMYLAPAFVGRMGGLGIAHAAMFAQNTILLGLALYLLAQCVERARFAFIAIVVMFSGLDIIAELLGSGFAKLPMHLDSWNPLFEYSSSITQFFWVPNHALPGWWFAGLVLLGIRGAWLPATMTGMFAALSLWSPLSMIGAAPFLAAVLARRWRNLLSVPMIAAIFAGLCFIPIALYLTSDAGEVPSAFLLLQANFLPVYVMFLLIEIPHARVVLAFPNLRCEPWRTPLYVALAILFVLPFYLFGLGNDLAMRGSIVALTILACAFATAVIEAAELRRWGVLWLAGALIVIGGVTPLVEILRNVLLPRYAFSQCDLITTYKETTPHFPSNYLARKDRVSGWLIAEPRAETGRRPAGSSCWPDHPLTDKSRLWRRPAPVWTLFGF